MANDFNSSAPVVGVDAFALKDCALLTIATGKKATSLRELRYHLHTIDTDSIYLHIWGSLLEPQFESREYNNHFGAWAHRGLHDDTLAERLAMVDPNQCPSLDALRQELLELIDERLEESEYLRWAQATEPFEFIRSTIVVFDSYKRVDSPMALAHLLPHLSPGSVFYHFIEARRRLPNNQDDFSHWLSGLGDRYGSLLRSLAGIDPYFSSLSEIRQQLAAVFQSGCAGVS